MRCRPRVSPLRRRVRRYTAVFLAIFTVSVTYTEFAVKSQLRDVIIRDMNTISVQAVASAVDDFLSENYNANERFTDITYDKGKVSSIAINPSYVNYAKTYITEHAQENIDYLSHHNGVSDDLGSFTGLIFLNGLGPEISFDVDSSQTVTCEFDSSFESAGINQTLHHIILTVTVELSVYNPFRIRDSIISETSYEIAQTVIVGEIPEYAGASLYSRR